MKVLIWNLLLVCRTSDAASGMLVGVCVLMGPLALVSVNKHPWGGKLAMVVDDVSVEKYPSIYNWPKHLGIFSMLQRIESDCGVRFDRYHMPYINDGKSGILIVFLNRSYTNSDLATVNSIINESPVAQIYTISVEDIIVTRDPDLRKMVDFILSNASHVKTNNDYLRDKGLADYFLKIPNDAIQNAGVCNDTNTAHSNVPTIVTNTAKKSSLPRFESNVGSIPNRIHMEANKPSETDGSKPVNKLENCRSKDSTVKELDAFKDSDVATSDGKGKDIPVGGGDIRDVDMKKRPSRNLRRKSKNK